MIYVQSALLTFIAVFLKGFQHKNVIGGHLTLIAITSYLMVFFDVLTISMVLKQGWTIAFSAGTGGALGMIMSIKIHDKFVKNKMPR